jgi:hypothetical protein
VHQPTSASAGAEKVTNRSVTATPTPKAIPGDADGDGERSERSEREKEIIAKATHAFTVPEGSMVKVDPIQPLLTAVVDFIRHETAPLAKLAGRGGRYIGAKNPYFDQVRFKGLLNACSGGDRQDTDRP